MQMSNTLLPIDELTALSPKPCLATDNNNTRTWVIVRSGGGGTNRERYGAWGWGERGNMRGRVIVEMRAKA